MASSSARKLCTNSNGCKQPAATSCEGCSQAFCTKHFIDHRRILSDEMDVIISEHDQFQHSLHQQTTNSDSHPFIQQIDEWEKASIQQIQQKANELRSELRQQATAHLYELSKNIGHLSEKLKDAREHDSFVETDLRDWKKTLDDLKANLVSPPTFSVTQDDTTSLMQNIFCNSNITNEVFERVFTNTARIEEKGQLAVHDTTTSHNEIRGKMQYASDCHKIRLRIERSANKWMFLGINAASTPLQEQSYASQSACGWTNNNYSWYHGQTTRENTSGSRIDMKTNDTISLICDCDNRKISMINERTNAKYEMAVDIIRCPFPWQLHVILYEPNSCVRILSPAS